MGIDYICREEDISKKLSGFTREREGGGGGLRKRQTKKKQS